MPASETAVGALDNEGVLGLVELVFELTSPGAFSTRFLTGVVGSPEAGTFFLSAPGDLGTLSPALFNGVFLGIGADILFVWFVLC